MYRGVFRLGVVQLAGWGVVSGYIWKVFVEGGYIVWLLLGYFGIIFESSLLVRLVQLEVIFIGNVGFGVQFQLSISLGYSCFVLQILQILFYFLQVYYEN